MLSCIFVEVNDGLKFIDNVDLSHYGLENFESHSELKYILDENTINLILKELKIRKEEVISITFSNHSDHCNCNICWAYPEDEE